MKRKWVSLLASFVLVLGAIFGNSSPAVAATHNCTDGGYVCLFQWTNFGAGKWQTSFSNIIGPWDGCLNIPPATWSNGTNVSDNSGSLVITGISSYPSGTNIILYNWTNCQSGGGLTSYPAWQTNSVSDLSTVPIGNGLNAYHTITSVAFHLACPPGGC